MPRRAVRRRWQGPADRKLHPAVVEYLLYGDTPERDEPGSTEVIAIRYLGDDSWREHWPALLAEWIEARPGERPTAWSEDEALGRKRGRERPLAWERRKLRGSGEQSAVWLDRGLYAFHSCDPSDPPQIESEAAWLKRLGLLVEGEEKRIPRAAWKPVRLNVDSEGWAPPQSDEQEVGRCQEG